MVNKLNIIIIIIIIIIIFLGCSLKNYKLNNGYTKVPLESKVYKNKIYFDSSILSIIDTAVFYEEYDQEKKIPKRKTPCKYCPSYSLFKFYSNGSFNMFFFDRNKIISINEIDPKFAGYRGVIFLKNDEIRFDLFGPVDENYNLGRISGSISVLGDKLYFKRDIDNNKYFTVYTKRKFQKPFFKYKTSW